MQGHLSGSVISICLPDFVDCAGKHELQSSQTLNQAIRAGGATSVAAGRISYLYGLNGSCVSLDTACSSSLVATHLAARDLHLSTADHALAGGVSLTLSASKTAAFSVTGTSGSGYVRSSNAHALDCVC